MNASVQREIVPGTSVTFSYIRRDYKNLIWGDNLAIDPSDYTRYTVTNPYDTTKTVDIYNLNPAKATAFNVLDQNSDQNSRVYTGFDVSFQTRAKGLNLFGGFSAGHQITNTCQVEDPNFLNYCDQNQYDIPMYNQFKLNGSYNLPWKLQIAASVQSYNGDARNATVDTRHRRDRPVAARDLERRPSHVPCGHARLRATTAANGVNADAVVGEHPVDRARLQAARPSEPGGFPPQAAVQPRASSARRTVRCVQRLQLGRRAHHACRPSAPHSTGRRRSSRVA